jgi:hypothetical protein
MFPTRHWSILRGTLAAGARVTVAHTLRDGRNGTLITPDAVWGVFSDQVGGMGTVKNVNIDSFQIADSTNVYLSNYDAANAHDYVVMARSYYSNDDSNF